jgi:hypothetical protein
MTENTNYKIVKEGNRFTAYEDGSVVSKGMLNQEDCLHSIWVVNGKNPEHFYTTVGNNVVLNIKEQGNL